MISGERLQRTARYGAAALGMVAVAMLAPPANAPAQQETAVTYAMDDLLDAPSAYLADDSESMGANGAPMAVEQDSAGVGAHGSPGADAAPPAPSCLTIACEAALQQTIFTARTQLSIRLLGAKAGAFGDADYDLIPNGADCNPGLNDYQWDFNFNRIPDYLEPTRFCFRDADKDLIVDEYEFVVPAPVPVTPAPANTLPKPLNNGGFTPYYPTWEPTKPELNVYGCYSWDCDGDGWQNESDPEPNNPYITGKNDPFDPNSQTSQDKRDEERREAARLEAQRQEQQREQAAREAARLEQQRLERQRQQQQQDREDYGY